MAENITKPVIKHYRMPKKTVTCTSNNHIVYGNYLSVVGSRDKIVGLIAYDWSTNTGCFSLALGSADVYVIGDNGVKVTDLVVDIAYI